jgi:hypothetical protein
MSVADMAVARAYLALSGDLALRAANIASAVPVDDNSKDRAEAMTEAGDRVAEILQPWKDES